MILYTFSINPDYELLLARITRSEAIILKPEAGGIITYILLASLVCSIAEYFLKSCLKYKNCVKQFFETAIIAPFESLCNIPKQFSFLPQNLSNIVASNETR